MGQVLRRESTFWEMPCFALLMRDHWWWMEGSGGGLALGTETLLKRHQTRLTLGLFAVAPGGPQSRVSVLHGSGTGNG